MGGYDREKYVRPHSVSSQSALRLFALDKLPRTPATRVDSAPFFGLDRPPKSTRGAGPSGQPKVHNVDHSSKKQAHDAANNSGQGKPIHHSNGPGGGGHYHPADKAGNKITDGQQGGVHHNYPKGK